jgi:hypothetical protein
MRERRMERIMKKVLFVLLVFVLTGVALPAQEIRVSIVMDETQPYHREFRYYLVRAITDIENLKLVEEGQGDWFRIHVLLTEMNLADETLLGYAIGYSIVEVPFYLHSYIFENIEPGKRQETTDELIRNTVFYRGSEMVFVATAGLQSASARIYSSLKRLVDERIRSQSE